MPLAIGIGISPVLGGGQSLLGRLLPLLSGKISPLFDPYDLSSMYVVDGNLAMTAVAASGNAVGLHLDKQYMGDLSASSFISAQPELRAGGAPALIGTVTAATYNTSTGAGTAVRVDLGNQSYVRFSSLAANISNRHYIDIQNTGATNLTVRDGTGNVMMTVASGTRSVGIISRTDAGTVIDIRGQGNGQTIAFTVHSLKVVPGYHRSQATGTKRPLYTEADGLKFLLYDGIDDCLPTLAVDYSGGDSMTVCAGVRKLSDAAAAAVIESSATVSSNNGTFRVAAPSTAAADYEFGSKGTGLSQATYTNAAVAAPNSSVLTGQGDISSDTCVLRVNGVQAATAATDQGTGNFGNFVINYGSRNNGGSLPFSGREYWSLVTPQIDSQVTALAEAIAAQKSGVSL